MKTLIDIDEQLLEDAMEITNARTKKETVHTALQELIRARYRQELISLKGSDLLELSLEELKGLRLRRTKKHRLNKKQC